jgi:hypothetical protein
MERNRISWMATSALLASILVVMEQALALVPNVQLTMLLIAVYSAALGFRKSAEIVAIYVVLDSMVASAMYPEWVGMTWALMPAILAGWLLSSYAFSWLKTESNLSAAALGAVMSFVYGTTVAVYTSALYQMDFLVYMSFDMPYQILMALSSFVSISLLYGRLVGIVRSQTKGEN